MGKNIEMQYDGPQSMEEAAKMVEQENNEQAELNNATQLGGKRKKYRMRNSRGRRTRRTRRRLRIRGGGPYDVPPGKIEVMPLPQGAQTGNTGENNTKAAGLYADSATDAMYDNKVGQKGGRKTRRRRSTRRRHRSKTRRGRKGKRRRTAKRKT